jgi:hypothetical protein
MVNNRKPAHTKKNAPLRAEVIRRAAKALQHKELRVDPIFGKGASDGWVEC